MAWTDYSSAPAPGTRVCPLAQVAGVLSLSVVTDKGSFPLLVTQAGGLRAYVNACPHQYLPLDYRSDQLLSADGTMLMCSAHGARFDISTGAALGGGLRAGRGSGGGRRWDGRHRARPGLDKPRARGPTRAPDRPCVRADGRYLQLSCLIGTTCTKPTPKFHIQLHRFTTFTCKLWRPRTCRAAGLSGTKAPEAGSDIV
ncbi:Rieske (2Fe-2S) protein [Paracoccus aerius]